MAEPDKEVKWFFAAIGLVVALIVWLMFLGAPEEPEPAKRRSR